MEDDSEDEGRMSPTISATNKPVESAEEDEQVEDVDPSMSDWFNIKDKSSNRLEVQRQETDSETEPDSDNEDVGHGGNNYPEEDADDDWSQVMEGDELPEETITEANVSSAYLASTNQKFDSVSRSWRKYAYLRSE